MSRNNMIKAKNWKGDDLAGAWEVSYKIDGVQVIVKNGRITSRNDKPLYNMGHLKLKDGTYEAFLGSWERTVSAVRASKLDHSVLKRHLYPLYPVIDKRLRCVTIFDPTAQAITRLLKRAVRNGYEGLMLRQGDKLLKVKPTYTHDVKVTGWVPGKGKHAGKVGALITTKGNVGTGFTDLERLHDDYVGKTIEVESMGLTPGGKFRHPRFTRVRFDK